MDEKSPKERFMEAAGAQVAEVPQGAPPPETMQQHLEQMQRTVETVLGDVQAATGAANASKASIKRLHEFLNNYCQVTMPEQMRQAFEKEARQVVMDTVRPLEDEVRKAIGVVDSLGRELSKWSWFWLRDIALCALSMGLVASLMVRCTMNRKLDEMDQAKRYEMWGRSVEQKVAQQPPEKRKRFRAWLGTPYDAVEK